ncbi:MAG: hypothetical protein OSB39_03755 [Opitutales bacterium]|nr:hypothetical protein [Opitutales bacterium]
MPLQFNKFMEPLRIFAVAISIVWPIVTVSARPIDKTLIESAILINHEELTNPGSLYASSRFRRSIIPDVDVNSTLAGLGTPWQNVPSGLAGTMKNLFVGSGKNTNDEIKEGVRLALEYIRDKRDNLGLDIDQIGKATQAIVQGALEASADRNTLTPDSLEWNAFGSGLEGVTPDEQALYENYLQRLDPADANNWTQSFESSSPAEKDTTVRAFLQIAPEGLAQLLPSVVIDTFIPIASRAWKVSAPDLVKSLSEGMARGTIIANLPNPAGSVSAQPDREKLMGFVSEGTITATMGRMKTATLLGGVDFGFHPGIDPIDANTTTSDATMMLGGNPKEPRFHPDKTRILEYAANGLTYGALAAAKDSGNILSVNVPTLAEQIGAGAAKAAVAFMADIPLGQDTNSNHHLFTYEVVKSIASGASLGSIMVSSSHKAWKIEKLPEQVAERVSYGVASAAIESNLLKQWPNDKKADIALLGEAAAFGSSMGAQFATVFDPVADNYSAWDYELYGKKASYDRIALAEATSKGSAQGAIAKAADSNGTASTRQEILNLARGSAMGSVLSNIAMAIYYETDLQSVIMASSQGSAYGSLTADNLYKIEKPQGQTEEFEVELARASANGATAGALFEVVSLLDAKPDIRRADIDSINSAKSATYGSTLGAILGGDKAGQDSVAIKQAVEQGSTEGSLDGVALAMGYDVDNVGQANIKSTDSIKKAVGLGNTQAATKAAAEMATKTIKASASDMLLLMQKYNISPGTTNPGFVFPNPKRKGEEDFLFEEKFPVASPI